MSRELQYQFDLQIHRVYVQIPFVCSVNIWWKRGSKKISTKKQINLTGTQKYFDVNEKLSIMSNCHFRDNCFLPKETTLEVVILIPQQQKYKSGGSYTFSMTEIIPPNGLTKPISRKYEVYLQNCPPNSRKISFSLYAKYIQETPENQNDISFQQGSTFTKSIDMTFRVPQQRNINTNRTQRPLQFSFSPVNGGQKQKILNFPKKDHITQDQIETITDLRKILQQRDDQVSQKQLQINKLKTKILELQKRDSKNNSQKIISLMNELNSTLNISQQLKNQKNQLNTNFNRLREEKNQILTSYAKIKDDYHFQRNQMSNRFELKKKQLQNLKKENDQLKSQIFKKQSQLINIQNKYQKILSQVQKQKAHYLKKSEMLKQQTQKLVELSTTAKELKSNYERLRRDKEQQQKSYIDLQKTIKIQEQTIDALRNHIKKIQSQFQKQKQIQKKNRILFENKFKQKQLIVQQIEQQFKKINSEKCQFAKQKDQQLNLVREKFNSACKKIDQLTNQLNEKQQSLKIQISQLKVQLQTMKGICASQEKDIQQKQVLITKAKDYITEKQFDIKQRNEFINKAKVYIEGKESQLANQKNRCHQLQQQIRKIKQIQSNKQHNISLFVQNNTNKDRRIKQLECQLMMLQQKLNIILDEFDEINRKNKSQQETLEELVRKNLDMQIQLNLKNYQLLSAKSTQ